MSKHLIVFVCTGNLCRSPMAEYLFRNRLGAGSEWDVRSVGISASSDMPASPGGVDALKEKNIDMVAHRSRPLDRKVVDAASLIVVMTASHRAQIRTLFPDVMEKVFLLKPFNPAAADNDIEDPIGMSLDAYRGIRDEIDAALPGLIEFTKNLDL